MAELHPVRSRLISADIFGKAACGMALTRAPARPEEPRLGQSASPYHLKRDRFWQLHLITPAAVTVRDGIAKDARLLRLRSWYAGATAGSALGPVA